MDAAGLAITVTSCILKLMAFSIDIISDAKQVLQQGATSTNLDLAMVAKSIGSATTSLENQLSEVNGQGRGNMNSTEIEILALATRAAAIGKGLTSRLNEIHTDSKSKRKTLKVVISGIWAREDIEKMEKQLDGIQNQIQLNILIDIRNFVRESRNEKYQQILLRIEQNMNDLSDSREEKKVIIEKLHQLGESIKRLHQQVDGSSTRYRSSSTGSAREPSSLKSAYDKDQRLKERAILRLLWYPSIRDREESISPAYPKTLNWIYDDSAVTKSTCKWDSFVDFLRGESSMYWITGKPGSGKSTLMKFIKEQPRTIEELTKWTSNRYLLPASFYFFYKGSDEQKTEIGLLRSLLHEIFSQRPDLIPLVFEERFTTALDDRQQAPITLSEVKRAIRVLFQRTPHLCYFFSIDGLDEFDAEVSLSHVNSLIALTELMRSFSNVKLVVSSRPLPEFEHSFATHPHLRIHHLTADDIHHYATQRLESHQYMQTLLQRNPIDYRRLIDSINSMSSGVFLWVRLVTESLLQGLTNRDTIYDLQERLEGLPSELQDLYKVIILRIDHRYRRQTCELLQLVYFSQLYNPKIRSIPQHGRDTRLTALELYFATKLEDYGNDLVNSPLVCDSDLEDFSRDLEFRLKSCCLGLIESTQDWNEFENDIRLRLRGRCLRFLHRTVQEFLEEANIKDKFLLAYCRPDFDPHRRLLGSAILAQKSCPFSLSHILVLSKNLLRIVFWRAVSSEYYTSNANSDFLQAFDAIMTGAFQNHTRSHWSGHYNIQSLLMKDCTDYFMPQDTHSSFLSLAVGFGLECYIKEQIKIHGTQILIKKGLPLLGLAIKNDGYSKMVQLLLDHKCNCGEVFRGLSVWGWYWRIFLNSGFEPESPYCSFFILPGRTLSLVMAMLAAGADPNIKIPWSFARYLVVEDDFRSNSNTPLALFKNIRKSILNNYTIQPASKIVGAFRMDLNEVESLIQVFKEFGGRDKARNKISAPGEWIQDWPRRLGALRFGEERRMRQRFNLTG